VGATTAQGMEYDQNGNLTRLNRQGRKADNSWGPIDALVYSYSSTNSNKISGIWDTSEQPAGFTDRTGANEYSYYADGSLKQDLSKEITSIEYNFLKLPRRMVLENGQTVGYQYDAAGNKLRKTVTGPGTFSSVTDYVGNQVWEQGALYQIAHDEGRIVPGSTAGTYRYEWALQDHLGNNRVSFAEVNSAASVVQQQHYDPWGWALPTLGTLGNPVNRYQFLNRETQSETGYIDLLARFYDAPIGRFHQLDPVTEGQEHLSLFQYGWNNPVLRSDPNGLFPEEEACCFGAPAARAVMRAAANAVTDFVVGASTAVLDNQTAINLRTQNGVGRSSAGAYNAGQDFGDALSVGVSLIEVVAGGTLVGGSGLLEGVSLGGATPIAAPALAGGAGLITLGVATGGRALQNLSEQRGRVNASSTASPTTDSSTPSTSRQARREAMRQEGIPTSQQPRSQSRNSSGREYSYDVPRQGGGMQRKSVQQQTKDRSHPGQNHWEAGNVKTDAQGNPRMNNYNRPKLENDKSKVDY
jgi:RHS repeat-associated protein